MYQESDLDRLRQRYPDLDERGIQLKDLLDSFGVSGREALPKLRAWLDAGEDPDAVLALHGPTTKESLLTGALSHRAPRVALVVLRRLCEKERARPPPELARLFALDKFIFWRVLAFWRTDRDLPHHIATSEPQPPRDEYFD